MTEEVRQIVELLNKDPFKKNYNLISFHSLGPEQLLQLLNDVFAEIDAKNAGDIRCVFMPFCRTYYSSYVVVKLFVVEFSEFLKRY